MRALRVPRSMLAASGLIGAALTLAPFVSYRPFFRALAQPGIVVSKALGATDVARVTDLVSYFVGGAVFWSLVALAVLVCIRWLRTGGNPAT